MARKNNPSTPANVLPPSIPPEKGMELMKRQIEAGRKLLAESYVNEHAYDAWSNTTNNYLVKAFGEGSPNVIGFGYLGSMMMAPMNAGDDWWQERRREGLQAKLPRLESYVELLRTEIELREPVTATSAPGSPSPMSRKVFVVHGHDTTAREACARLLQKLGLEPVILHEMPNAGRTIIEKFHDYSDVGFAVVILTGDDKGAAKDADVTALKLRARQNVILELGFFLAKLGRSRVCALYEEGVELPSDYDGVLFTKLDSSSAWHFQLCRELKAAGIDVDLNKVV
jgi:predicted nucleotide-binding protein